MAAKLEQKTRTHGKLLRLNFKKIDDKYYRVRVFEKVEAEDTYYNFIIGSISIHDKQRAMLSYKTNEVKLVNSHGLYLVDYLTDSLRRKQTEDGFVFYFQLPDRPDHVKIRSNSFTEEDAEEDLEIEDLKDTFDTVK